MFHFSHVSSAVISVAVFTAAFPLSAAGQTDEEKSPIKITVSPTEASPSLVDINGGRFKVTLKIENTGKKALVLWPYLSVQVLDSKDQPVAKTRNLGRWGFVRSSAIEEVPFVSLKPGEHHTIQINLPKYAYDADFLSGWRLGETGEYELVLHYQFDRTGAKKKYGDGCPAIDDVTKPWNQALEVDKTLKVKLAVK